jgi:hypothetical protein
MGMGLPRHPRSARRCLRLDRTAPGARSVGLVTGLEGAMAGRSGPDAAHGLAISALSGGVGRGETACKMGQEEIGARGRRPGSKGPQPWRVIVRNLIKVSPWQLAHMGTARLVVSSGSDPVATWLVAWLVDPADIHRRSHPYGNDRLARPIGRDPGRCGRPVTWMLRRMRPEGPRTEAHL